MSKPVTGAQVAAARLRIATQRANVRYIGQPSKAFTRNSSNGTFEIFGTTPGIGCIPPYIHPTSQLGAEANGSTRLPAVSVSGPN